MTDKSKRKILKLFPFAHLVVFNQVCRNSRLEISQLLLSRDKIVSVSVRSIV